MSVFREQWVRPPAAHRGSTGRRAQGSKAAPEPWATSLDALESERLQAMDCVCVGLHPLRSPYPMVIDLGELPLT